MEFPITVEDQAAFDKLVGTRLTREREKFADYDDLKAQVATLTEATKTHDDALAAAVKRAEDAEGKVAARDEADAFAKVRTEVATAAGLPADVLRGTTKEELEAHAAALKPLITAPKGPVIPNQGDTPDKTAVASDERSAVKALFGPGGD